MHTHTHTPVTHVHTPLIDTHTPLRDSVYRVGWGSAYGCFKATLCSWYSQHYSSYHVTKHTATSGRVFTSVIKNVRHSIRGKGDFKQMTWCHAIPSTLVLCVADVLGGFYIDMAELTVTVIP